MGNCRECGASHETARFYVSNKNRCAECVKSRVHAYRLANLQKVRDYDNLRAFQEKRVMARRAYAEANRGAQRNKPVIEWKRRANHKMGNAVRDKKLVKPTLCEACGRVERLDGHHYDYTKPLEVVWLCKTCHGQVHRYENERARQKVKEFA